MWRVDRRTGNDEYYKERSFEQKLPCTIKMTASYFDMSGVKKQNVRDNIGPLEDSVRNKISQGF